MKLHKGLTILLSVVVLVITSCVKDSDYSIPNSLGNEENEKIKEILNLIETDDTWNMVSIADVKAKYKSRGPVLIEQNDIIKAYVTSSDQSGNFFKEFYIQDEGEEMAGIKVSLNLTSSYSRFNIGREVYINLNGLYIGESNSGDGVITIGGKIKTNDSREVNSISENQIFDHIFRSKNTKKITPSLVKISQVDDSKIGMFVKIDSVYFDSSIVGKTYVDPTDDFDTQRKLERCNDEGELLLETSSFANFGSSKIPGNAGCISGIISKDFGGDNLVLVLNSLDDVVLTEDYECSSIVKNLNKFDFENTATTSVSYTKTETLTAADGTELNYLARTNVGSYAIEGKGLMLKEAQHIRITFNDGIKQLKFKYRGAFSDKTDRIVIVYEGDENSTTELERKEFSYDTTLGEFELDLNKTEAYTVTIKGGTTKQIVIDDVEWTNME